MPTWLIALDRYFPIRYLTMLAAGLALLAGLSSWLLVHQGAWLALLGAAGLVIGIRDLRQTRHALLRNYPVIGHVRFLFEWVRPEIRQYLLESDREAAPFSRQQRSLVYQRSKGESDKRPFGTQLDVGEAGYEWINHSMQPSKLASHDFRVRIGGDRCTQPYSASLFNISAMSFGALSANAILALNGGAKAGGFMHDTGEGSISVHHRQNGGDLVWEIGSGYFGCRDEHGRFDEARFEANARDPQVKLIELKLSQGAKPGHGGVLPGPKVSLEIASARGVPVGVDCVSPAAHTAFTTPRACCSSSTDCAACRVASRWGSSCASGTPGNGLHWPRRWPRATCCPTSSSSTVPKAGPVLRRWSSATTWAHRCRKDCAWCTTRWSA